MKQFIIIILISVYAFSCYAQEHDDNQYPENKDKQEKVKQKKESNNQYLAWDTDDIYAGKNPDVDFSENSDRHPGEERMHRRDFDPDRTYPDYETREERRKAYATSQAAELILNIGLIFLWAALHY